MRTILMLALVVVMGSAFAAPVTQSEEKEGIQFSHRNWAEMLALAKKENKKIFIDCYTSWCGPCKMLSK